MSKKRFQFRDYQQEAPSCPVKCVTPDDGFYIHNFFDVCPWSPSGRYLVCIRLPFQDHPPPPDDSADICVVDLEEEAIETVYATTAWGMQTGAHQQWGRTDDVLYFNDKKDGLPRGVRFDLKTRTPEFLDGPIYQVAPDESCAVSPAFMIFNHLQEGYTATLAPELDRKAAPGAPDDEGLWRVWTMGQNPYPESNRDNVLRVDPHPAWSRDHTHACFTGAPDGRRQLFVADLRPLLAG